MRKFAVPLLVVVLTAAAVTTLYYHTQRAHAYLVRGDRLYVSGQVAQALGLYEEARRLRPEDDHVLNKIAAVATETGQYDLAEQVLREQASRKPGEVRYQIGLGNVAVYKKDYAGAAARYRRALDTTPKNDGLRITLAQALQWARQYAEAVAELGVTRLPLCSVLSFSPHE